MKSRIRLDLSFENEVDAQSLLAYVKDVSARAVSINEGEPNEEISFYDAETCGHDEGLPCTRLDRVEIRKLAINPER